MESFALAMLTALVVGFSILSIWAGARRKDDFWEDKPKPYRRGRRVR